MLNNSEETGDEQLNAAPSKPERAGRVSRCRVWTCFNTGSPHKLCDRLYFEFIEAMYGNIENSRIIVLDCDRYSH